MVCAFFFRYLFLLTPLREGRLRNVGRERRVNCISTHAPAGGATHRGQHRPQGVRHFYSRPCGRGDRRGPAFRLRETISTHAPAGGATPVELWPIPPHWIFLLTPLREGRLSWKSYMKKRRLFLLTPLREGRPLCLSRSWLFILISTHAPAGGATQCRCDLQGRRLISTHAPAGGATHQGANKHARIMISTHAPAGGATSPRDVEGAFFLISTHAPAGGATAIFHKSVMRFCGKLPKDDTVLCLASFGFPRRDPKAVYLAWISCANLPQKCVRQGLALKDQGTSCFHEGLASHTFDPVLV